MRSPPTTSATSTALRETARPGRFALLLSFPRWSRLSPMRFTVRTPASSANLGPGFDALGMALGLWNEATVDPFGKPGLVTLRGTEAGLLDGRENLALTAMNRLAQETGRTLPPFAL